MKKLILLIIAAAISSSTFCQLNTTENRMTADAYLLKAKKQKIAAWICLGGGLVMMATATAITVTKGVGDAITSIFVEPEPSNDTGESILMVAGGAAVIGSIPLFIGAANNKHKAKLTMTEQKTAIGLPIAVPKKIPSLTLTVSL